MDRSDPTSGRTGSTGPDVLGTMVLDQISAAIARIVEAVSPAIVSVRISRPGPVPAPAHVGGLEIGSAGSGVVVAPDGLIITNAHVVNRARSVRVTFDDGASRAADILGTDDETDLALLQVGASGLPCLSWAEPFIVRPGTFVMALGRPGGTQITVTTGIVSATGRTLRTASGALVQNVIQTSAALSPGTSGGALIDVHGHLLGLNVAAPPASSGVAFAIPAETAQWATERLLADGKIARRYLGFAGQATPIDPSLAKLLGLTPPVGISVEHLEPGGPAEQGGLRRKDIIVEIAGRNTYDLGIVQRMVAEPGLTGPLKVAAIRGDKRIELVVEPHDDSALAAGS
ncbi:MAG: trypsin-like peptidase domain-containing protein [Chloroflexi bacterium]|nr:trypsin-like peptidase domain-containing protein [Chloroflexota bacterium]